MLKGGEFIVYWTLLRVALSHMEGHARGRSSDWAEFLQGSWYVWSLAEGSLLHRGRSAADLVSVGNCLTEHSHHLVPAGLVRSRVVGYGRSVGHVS